MRSLSLVMFAILALIVRSNGAPGKFRPYRYLRLTNRLCLLNVPSCLVFLCPFTVNCDAQVADVSVLDNLCSFDLSSRDRECSDSGKSCGVIAGTTVGESIVKSYAVGHLKLDLSKTDLVLQSAVPSYRGKQPIKASLRGYPDISTLASVLSVECMVSSSRTVRFSLLQSSSMCPVEQTPSFIIPSLSEHSNIPLTNYIDIDDDDTSSLDILLILSVSSTFSSKVFLDTSLLSTCALKFTPSSQQEQYPPKQVVAVAKPPTTPSKRPMNPITLSRVTCVPSATAQLLPSSTLIVATAHAATHAAAPREAVFLETEATVGAGAKVQWVASAVSAVMNPVIRTVEDQSAINMASSINSLLRFTLNQRVPPQVTHLVLESLRRNITNIAVDGISAMLVPTLEKSLSLSLSNPVADHINAWLPNPLSEKLSDLLERSLSHHVINDIPEHLRRMLPSALTMTLTRSITHAVTPTVATTLSKSTEYGHYCYLCYYHKKACWLCGSSSESMYYNNYHATYYSDYFSDYYTPYYYAAITKVTNRNVPTVLPESMGYVDKTGKDIGPGPKA